MDNIPDDNKPEQPPVERDSKGRWKKGRSANPGGGQRGKTSLASRLKPDDIHRALEILRGRMGRKGEAATDAAFDAAKFVASTLPKPRPVSSPRYIEAAANAETTAEKAEAIGAAMTNGEIGPTEAGDMVQTLRGVSELTEIAALRDELKTIRELIQGNRR